MRPRAKDESQGHLLQIPLSRVVAPEHPLIHRAEKIDWRQFEEAFGSLYSPDQGAPGKRMWLMVGLHYLKHTYDLSDEQLVARWVENPCRPYFCGEVYFQHERRIEQIGMGAEGGQFQPGRFGHLTDSCGVAVQADGSRESVLGAQHRALVIVRQVRVGHSHFRDGLKLSPHRAERLHQGKATNTRRRLLSTRVIRHLCRCRAAVARQIRGQLYDHFESPWDCT